VPDAGDRSAAREAARAGTRPMGGLLRHPDFMKLWTGQTISQFGTQVSLLALPLIAANILKVAPFEFGLLGTLEFLPFILLSLPAGVWVDRLRRRPILIVGDLGRGIALASVPLAYAFGVLTIWQLYVVGFVNGCLTVFFDVAYQSYLPALVDRSEILEGNAKLETSRSAAQIAGPGLAGFLIGIASAPFAIVLDTVSYVVSAVFMLLIRRQEPLPQGHREADGARRTQMRTEIAAGLGYVLRHAYLRSIAACTAISNLFSTVVGSILVLYLVRAYNIQAEQLGLAFSLASIGFLIGAVTANRIGSRIGVGPAIILSAVVFSPSWILVAVAPGDLVLPFAAASLFIAGLAGAVYNINQVSFRQAITPERMQGRMNATMRFIVWGTIPIGTMLGGFLGGVIGLHETIWIGAVGGVISFVPLLFSPLRSLRQMPEPVGAQPDAIARAAEGDLVVDLLAPPEARPEA
jgi:MFS family permease